MENRLWIDLKDWLFDPTVGKIQLGGISGDVIDIGVLRTTLMETGQWGKADLESIRMQLRS